MPGGRAVPAGQVVNRDGMGWDGEEKKGKGRKAKEGMGR